MILQRELQWGHEPGWFSTLTTEQQAEILALLKLEAQEARQRALADRARRARTPGSRWR